MQMVQRTFSDDEETNIDAVAIIQGGYDGGLVPDYICFRYDKVSGNLAVIRISAWQRSYCAKIARILTSCGFAKITVMRNAIQYTDPSRNSCDFLKMIKQMSNRPIILLMNRSCFGSSKQDCMKLIDINNGVHTKRDFKLSDPCINGSCLISIGTKKSTAAYFTAEGKPGTIYRDANIIEDLNK